VEGYTKYWIPHLGLGYLAGMLAKHDYDFEVIDCVAEKLPLPKLGDILKKIQIDMLCVTATTPEIINAHEVCHIAKSINPRALTIVGGPHTTALPKETLEEFPFFDIAVAGEGEYTLLKILKREVPCSEIPGIAYRKNGKLFQNPPAAEIEQLDEISFPHWSAFPLKKYKGLLKFFKGLEFPIITGRGCPYRCIFCQRALGQKVRFRSVESVIEEIKYDISLGAKSLYFCDESFSINKNRAMEICKRIQKQGLNKKISWSCETRVDLVDEELLLEMKRAGCELLSFGVESGNEEILKTSQKGITLNQVDRAFYFAKKVNLKTYMFLIFGLPGETEETIGETTNLIKKLNPDYLTIGILVPFPGTRVYEMAEQGIGGLKLSGDRWADYSKQIGRAIELETIAIEKLRLYQTKTYVKFYFRPGRILNLLKMASISGIFQLAMARMRRKSFSK
jgi:radical SAM superfamily enzyme YgiQ (UPF0313 family)